MVRSRTFYRPWREFSGFDQGDRLVESPDWGTAEINSLMSLRRNFNGSDMHPDWEYLSQMKFSEQLELAKSTKHIHSTWYRETYPEVAELGIDPATHYLRYGAAMGRNPGTNFDTRFYLENHPDAAASGLNPLVHYAKHGKAAGYATQPKLEDPRRQVNVIRTKLLSLGFTERPLAELTEIARTSEEPVARAMAARELALWHMRAKTEADYRTALDWIERARNDAPALDFRAQLSTVELLCHYHLDDHSAGLAAYDRAALVGESTPDLLLARVNFEKTPENRILWINQALARYGIEPITLLPDMGQPAYDRLTCAVDLPKVTDGPKVTVLIAAYDAADMLPTALRSLQEQTWQNLQIIVLDDCSPTMDTMRVAEKFAESDPRIQVVRMPENGGAYVARNHGLDMATGEFVTLHDADDWSHPRKIETQVRFMNENPEVMGCTSDQARCQEDMGFGKVRGGGGFIIFNTSSFLWRRAQVREALGYWDTVRFGADSEFIRRMQKVFGRSSFRKLTTGPLSFPREALTSITSDPVKGLQAGAYYGVRKEYHEAEIHHHETASSLRYSGNPDDRPFPVPQMMCTKETPATHYVDVVVAGDFRPPCDRTRNALEASSAALREGKTVGIVQYYDYDLECLHNTMCAEMRKFIDGEQVSLLSYGETISCDLLVLRGPPILQELQSYVPAIDAKEIKVIVNQPPMSDYGPDGVIRYELHKCTENIRRYFGKDAMWHPIGPLVREALYTHHADQLHHINLSDQDWHNIIDATGWDRGASPARAEGQIMHRSAFTRKCP